MATQMMGPFGRRCLPFGLGVNVQDTTYEAGHCDLSYSTRGSPCHGHHFFSIDAELFFSENPKIRASALVAKRRAIDRLDDNSEE
jgi:hypothetical protein